MDRLLFLDCSMGLETSPHVGTTPLTSPRLDLLVIPLLLIRLILLEDVLLVGGPLDRLMLLEGVLLVGGPLVGGPLVIVLLAGLLPLVGVVAPSVLFTPTYGVPHGIPKSMILILRS